MIKRTYFMSAKAYSEDGSEGFMYVDVSASLTSFLPRPEQAYNELREVCRSKCNNSPLLSIESFNRI